MFCCLKTVLRTSWRPCVSLLSSTSRRARPSNCRIRCQRRLSSHPGEVDDVLAVLRYKRASALVLGGSVLLLAMWLRRRRANRALKLLQDCERVLLPSGHYKDDINFYVYRNYIIPSQIAFSGALQELPNFQFHDDDVVVASFPKADTDPSLETRFPYLEYPYPGLKTINSTPGPRCIKTHLPYSLLPPSIHSRSTKIVYVSRNPRDTAVSYYHFVRLLINSGFIGTFDDFIDDFLDDKVPYSPFHKHARSYCEAARDNQAVLMLRYEEMIRDPSAAVRAIAKHLQVALSEEDVKFVVQSTTFEVMAKNKSTNYEHWKDVGFARKDGGNFLRKGVVGDWRNALSSSQVERFRAWEQRNRLPEDHTPLFDKADSHTSQTSDR